jgi:hypothetical protein
MVSARSATYLRMADRLNRIDSESTYWLDCAAIPEAKPKAARALAPPSPARAFLCGVGAKRRRCYGFICLRRNRSLMLGSKAPPWERMTHALPRPVFRD